MANTTAAAARPGAVNNAGGGGRIAQFKLVLLGESAVGKSSLVLRFVKGQFHEFQVTFVDLVLGQGLILELIKWRKLIIVAFVKAVYESCKKQMRRVSNFSNVNENLRSSTQTHSQGSVSIIEPVLWPDCNRIRCC